jgi:hypothetical protein
MPEEQDRPILHPQGIPLAHPKQQAPLTKILGRLLAPKRPTIKHSQPRRWKQKRTFY